MVDRPAWFLTGALDALRAFEPPEAEMRQAMPNLLGLTVLDGVGHWPRLEAPSLVNDALLRSLARIPPRGA